MTCISLSFPLFKSGLQALKNHRHPNADTLSAAAILFSLLAKRGVSALTIIWLADIAELLTAYSMDRTRRAIREMLSVGEEFVWKVKKDGSLVKVELNSIKEDDLIAVHTGEKISVDGMVRDGTASVDQSSLTGEFFPVRKQTDDDVFAGTVVKSGNLTVCARDVGDKTAIARVIHMVEEASYRKSSIQGFADRFSAKFIPVNFLLAFFVYLIT
ncbi:MAG: cation-transporting P-type ATPase, partial [bacterium]|nr:cation-transporting P-type ATPase [bacterium]